LGGDAGGIPVYKAAVPESVSRRAIYPVSFPGGADAIVCAGPPGPALPNLWDMTLALVEMHQAWWLMRPSC